MDLVADLAQVEQLPLAMGGGVGEPIDLVWFGRHRQHAGALPFGVEPTDSISACMPSRFSRPIGSSTSISLGQRAFPFSTPCVRLASTKPPLRPDAAQPIRLASMRTIRRSGSRWAACNAVHSPA